MKLLAIGRLREQPDVRAWIAQLAVAEMRALWELYRADVVREMYSVGSPGAVLILEAESQDAARVVLADLPLVAGGVIDFEVSSCTPSSCAGWR